MKKNRMNIYKMTNLINGMIYIGQSEYDDPTYPGSGKRLKPALKFFGKKNFKKEIIQDCSSQKEMDEREIYWIEELHANDPEIGYNIAKGGRGYPRFEWTPEKRRKHSELWTPERRKKKGEDMMGEKNWSFGKTGELSPNFGKKASDKTKKKIGDGNRGKKRTEEQNRRNGESRKGKNCGENNWNFGRYGGNHPHARPIKIHGIDYLSIIEASMELNINPNTLYSWIRAGKEGYEFADESDADREARRKKYIKPIRDYHGKNGPNAKAVIADGIDFSSIAEASRELNMYGGTVVYRINIGKEGYSWAGDTPEDIEARRKSNIKVKRNHHEEKNPNARAVMAEGKHFPAIVVASRELNISIWTIQYRIKTGKEGYSYANDTQEDIETRRKANIKKKRNQYGGNNPNAKAVTINEIDYSTMKEASEKTNISSSLIIYRIKTGKEGYSYTDEK